MHSVAVLLALVPAAFCALQPENLPRPTVRGFSTINGVCDASAGIIEGALFRGREGTLKSCAQKCSDNAQCKGYNFVTDSNECQLFRQECADTTPVARTAANRNFYLKGEIACSTSTVGDEFYLAFMANRVAQPKNMSLEIWVTQDRNANGSTVTLESDPNPTGNAAEKQVFKVPFKQAVRRTVPFTWKIQDLDFGVSIEKKGLKVSSDDDFVMYGVNKEFFTADAYLGIPSRALGLEYVANCYWPPFYNCEFAITPAGDGVTTIEITLPKVSARNEGNWAAPPPASKKCALPYNGQTYTNGDKFTITLREFEVAQIQDECDLTGAYIDSDKPIAVWSGNSRVNVGNSPSRDHQVEQLFSTDTWGTECIAWPTPNRVAGLVDYWVVTAAVDNTVITVDSNERGQFKQTLQSLESVRFPAASVTEWMRFSSAKGKPFQAVQYASSAVDNSIPGDPSMTVCIPSDQFGFGYTFVTPTGVSSPYTNYLTIITNKAARAGFILDEQPVTGVQWKDIPGTTDFIGGVVTLDSNKQQFRIDHRTKGTTFEAYIFGSGDRESIAYPTGACIKALGECVKTTMFIADGKDNDCDGVIDEELFDGIDNDFDGQIDEDCYDRRVVPTDRCPTVMTAEACNGGQLNLKCTDGTIQIISAHYGRLSRPGEKTCGSENVVDSCSGSDVGCGWTDISMTVATQCDAAQNCSLPANQFQSWNKCPACSLYAHVQYVCLNVREQLHSSLTGDNRKASSYLESKVLSGSCGDKTPQSGDLWHPSKGDHDSTSAVEAWRPASCDKNSSWIQTDLGSTYAVGWYAISGCRRNDFWTTKFAISYSQDGVTWTIIKDGNDPKLFDGNTDAVTAKVCTLFQYNIVARYVRIHPIEYNNWPCAHIDFGHSSTFSGCPLTTVANSNFAAGANAGAGSTATVTCNKGWATAQAETTYSVKCGADGKWASNFRDCSSLLHCPDMPSIDGGYAVGPSTLPGATIQFRCNQGRTLRGSAQATCRQDGTWSNAAPTCEAQQ